MIEHVGDLGAWAAGMIALVLVNVFQVIRSRKTQNEIARQARPNGVDSELTLREQLDATRKDLRSMQQEMARGTAAMIERMDQSYVDAMVHSALIWLLINHAPKDSRLYAVWIGDEGGNNIETSAGYKKFFGISGLGIDWYSVVPEKERSYIGDFLAALSGTTTEFSRMNISLNVVHPRGDTEPVPCDVYARIIRHPVTKKAVRNVGLVHHREIYSNAAS